MNRSAMCFLMLSAALLVSISSCNSQDKSASGANQSKKNGKPGSSRVYNEGQDYTVFQRARILDKQGFDKPAEAFSMLFPKDWTFEGAINWIPPGSTCAGTSKQVKASSPDGSYSFEMYPGTLWGYNSDPYMQNMSRSTAPGGPEVCGGFGQPMDAAQYVKNVFVRNLGNPQVQEIKESREGRQAMQNDFEKVRRELMSYGASDVNFEISAITANVKWNNKLEGIVICGINNMVSTLPNAYNGTSSQLYTTAVSELIVFKFPAGEKEKAAKLLSVIMSSVRTNDRWKTSVDNFWAGVRRQSNTVHIGKLKMMADQTARIGANAIKKGQQNLDNMDASMRNWEAAQQSQDRIHTNFVKTIRGVENYQDATGKIELSSGYNHAWSRSDGSSYIMSDNPNFDPSSVLLDNSWKEMKKVE